MIWPGGIAAYIDSLARGLVSIGDTVKMLAVIRPDEKEPVDFLEAQKPLVFPFQLTNDEKPHNWLGRKFFSILEILRCQSPRCYRFLNGASFFEASTGTILRLEAILSTEKPTAVIFGHLDARLYPLALCLLAQQVPYGIIAHDFEMYRPPNIKRNDNVIRGLMIKGASWIAANSRQTKSLLDAWRIPSERVKVIYPPISEEVLKESAVGTPLVRDGDCLNLLTICRLVRGKGVDIVLRALKILAAKGIPYRYVVGGDGPERKFLEGLADELELGRNVDFIGPVTGAKKWSAVRNADIFVMTSRPDATIPWQEGFGIAFAEAAAFGIPAVGSKSGGIPDAVIDGETGILVPEESPADVAEALTFLYRQPEKRKLMGKTARERALGLLSPTAIAARFREEVLKAMRR